MLQNIFRSGLLKGKDSLVNEVEAVQKDASLLAVGWKYNRDYLIVLPDKRVVLWRYSMYGEPIKWEAEHLAGTSSLGGIKTCRIRLKFCVT